MVLSENLTDNEVEQICNVVVVCLFVVVVVGHGSFVIPSPKSTLLMTEHILR